MRGEDRTLGALFSYVDIEARIPARHPLQAMRRLRDFNEGQKIAYEVVPDKRTGKSSAENLKPV